MSSATMAFREQAAAGLQATWAALAAAGLGFTDDDKAAISAAATAHPVPAEYQPGGATEADIAAAREVGLRAMQAEYPPNGYATDEPKLAPIEGVSIYVAAIAAKAIGFAWEDDAFVGRVVRALGVDLNTYRRASVVWKQRVTDDVVLATFYGQVFSQL